MKSFKKKPDPLSNVSAIFWKKHGDSSVVAIDRIISPSKERWHCREINCKYGKSDHGGDAYFNVRGYHE